MFTHTTTGTHLSACYYNKCELDSSFHHSNEAVSSPQRYNHICSSAMKHWLLVARQSDTVGRNEKDTTLKRDEAY